VTPPSSDQTRATSSDPGALVTEAQDRFIGAWGQMGGAWGISRTMAEVHALLYITGEALCTDDVIERLAISRGNASITLRALQDWGLIYRVHKRGDRKEYFESESDVWAMFKTIARERKKRELDPVLASLHEVRDLTGLEPTPKRKKPAPGASDNGDALTEEERLQRHNERLDNMLEFMDTIEKLGEILVGADGVGLKVARMMIDKFG